MFAVVCHCHLSAIYCFRTNSPGFLWRLGCWVGRGALPPANHRVPQLPLWASVSSSVQRGSDPTIIEVCFSSQACSCLQATRGYPVRSAPCEVRLPAQEEVGKVPSICIISLTHLTFREILVGTPVFKR